MKKNYRWGILGAGKIAEKFCAAINFVEGSEVYAVASRDEAKAKDYAERHGAQKWYNNYNELMADPAVDIIYVATPHNFHYEQAMACINNKKAVLCEKPLTLRYSESFALTEAAKAAGVFFMEAMWTACMPFLQKVKALIAADVIGEVKYLSADFCFNFPFDEESRVYNKALGAGSLLDVGIYPLFLATTLLGEPSLIKSITKLTGTGVDEYCNMSLQYAGGASAQLVCGISFQSPITADIIGTKGRINIHNPWFKATDFSVYLEDGTTEDFSIPHGCNGFEHEVIEVMHCLEKGLLQSEKMPHQLTLSMSRIMEDVLNEAGIVY